MGDEGNHNDGNEFNEEDEEGLESKKDDRPHWINDLPESVKNQILYTDAGASDDEIFWIYARNLKVKKAKTKLKKMKEYLDDLMKIGEPAAIEKAQQELQKEEDEFINLYLHKVEINESLPHIKPLEKGIRRAIFKRQYCVFNVTESEEQKELYLKAKKFRWDQYVMYRIMNKHSQAMLNELYHLEWEYYKRFLSLKRSAVFEDPLGENGEYTDEQLRTLKLNNAPTENHPSQKRKRMWWQGGGNAVLKAAKVDGSNASGAGASSNPSAGKSSNANSGGAGSSKNKKNKKNNKNPGQQSQPANDRQANWHPSGQTSFQQPPPYYSQDPYNHNPSYQSNAYSWNQNSYNQPNRGQNYSGHPNQPYYSQRNTYNQSQYRQNFSRQNTYKQEPHHRQNSSGQNTLKQEPDWSVDY